MLIFHLLTFKGISLVILPQSVALALQGKYLKIAITEKALVKKFSF